MAILKRQTATMGTRYQVVMNDYEPLTHKRKRHIIGTFATKKEAQKAERDVLNARDSGKFVRRSDDTVADLLRLWVDTKRGDVRNISMVAYESAINNHLIPDLGHIPAQQLEPMDIQLAINAWTGKGHYRTANVARKILSAACRQGVALRLISSNPVEGTTIPSDPSPPERNVWDEASVQAFLRVAADDALAPLWFLLVETGVRKSEALGLHWSDVDWAQSAILISHSAVLNRPSGSGPTMIIQPMLKTNKSYRVILISADLLSRLREWRKSHTSSNLVFPNKDNGPMYSSSLGKMLARLAKQAGVPRLTVHELRHTAATRMMRAGIPMAVAQKRMGHKSSDMLLRIYQHAGANEQAEAVAALERLSAAALSLPYADATGSKVQYPVVITDSGEIGQDSADTGVVVGEMPMDIG